MSLRSPVTFWLLVAATIAVNAVAVRWLKLADSVSVAAYFYEALISGQLAVVCLWSVFSARRAWWGWISVGCAVLGATLLTSYATQLTLVETGGIYAIFATALTAALWVLRRTTFWQRLSGAGQSEWQYSLAHLLAVMTLIAVLVPTLKNSQILSDASELWKFLVVMTTGDVILVIGTTILWVWSREREWLPYWFPRFGTITSLAIVLGIVEATLARSGILGADVATAVQRRAGSEFVAYTMLMSFVIILWLELAPIVPVFPRAKSPVANQIEGNGTDQQ